MVSASAEAGTRRAVRLDKIGVSGVFPDAGVVGKMPNFGKGTIYGISIIPVTTQVSLEVSGLLQATNTRWMEVE